MTSKPSALSVLILSGGLDSSILAQEMAKSGENFRGLYVDFGKAISAKEIAAVKSLALELHFPVDFVSIPGLAAMQRGYVPDSHVDRDELDIELIPATSVPYTSGFHILLGIGIYYAQIIGADSLALGVIKNQLDYRPALPEVFTKMTEVASSLNPHHAGFQVRTPYMQKTKAEVVQLGYSLGAPMEKSWSCTNLGSAHCGVCNQCISRRNAFKNANIKDPTDYLK